LFYSKVFTSRIILFGLLVLVSKEVIMKDRKLIFSMVGIAIVLALIGVVIFTHTSLAQQIQQMIGIDPDAGASPASQQGTANTGDQPDENGYQGPIPMPAESTPAPDTIDGPFMPPNPFPYNLDHEPDSQDANIMAAPAWSNFYYIFTAGSSLHSADYTMRQDYQSGACVAAVDTGSQFFTLNLDLPDGVRIDYLRLFYYDTDASTGTANIRKYDAAGGYTEIATVGSAGNVGFGTTLSAYVGHVVNNFDGGYVLNWLPSVASTSMQLCGLRVAYRLP
jgi:hypothetical protein